MIRISAIGRHVPEQRLDNSGRLAEFAMDLDFLDGKIGTRAVSRKPDGSETSDLCLAAFADLVARSGISVADLDCFAVVSQNPDGRGLPHTSAILHGKLGARGDCAVFDISLGCSGFVHGLSILSAFMAANKMSRGVLFTADPYSKIIDPTDKNTVLLFGDAACATLLECDQGVAAPRGFTFATDGKQADALVNRDGILFMNGRSVFNYSAMAVPPLVQRCLDGVGLVADDIDLFVFHQGSRFIVDTLVKRLALPSAKVPMNLAEQGNSVSSSIPLLLADRLADPSWNRMLLCGFGVGLSAAACILDRA